VYGLARDLKEALLGRQPNVLLLSVFFFFQFSFSVFLHDLFPLLGLYMFTLKSNVESKHGGGIFCVNK